MKLTRAAIAVTLGVSALAAGHASAATKAKPVCNLITDDAGDANLIGPDPNHDALDILSADLATDKKNVTAVIRVKKLATTDPTIAPTGMRWQLSFTQDGEIIALAAHASATGVITYDGSYKTTAEKTGHIYTGGFTGTFDATANEIHITAPVSLLSGQATLKPGTMLSDLAADAYSDVSVQVPQAGVGAADAIPIDTATSAKPYAAGTPSCVTPGK